MFLGNASIGVAPATPIITSLYFIALSVEGISNQIDKTFTVVKLLVIILII